MFYTTIIVAIDEFRHLFLTQIYSYDKSKYKDLNIENLDEEDLYIWIVQRTLNECFEQKFKRTYFNTSHINILYDMIYDDLKHVLISTIGPSMEKFYKHADKNKIDKNIIIENMQLIVTNNTFMLTIGEIEKDE